MNFKIGGQNGGGRYQQVDMTMTPPPANRLLNHHGSLSSADSSILYTGYFQWDWCSIMNFFNRKIQKNPKLGAVSLWFSRYCLNWTISLWILYRLSTLSCDCEIKFPPFFPNQLKNACQFFLYFPHYSETIRSNLLNF